MSSDPKTNPASNASDSSTVDAPPGFGPEALKELFSRNQKVESENALLRQQLEDVRSLIEQDRESRERERAYRDQERASMDLLWAQMTQQNAQGPYTPKRDTGPWVTDSSSVHLPPFNQPSQYPQQQPSLTGGSP